MSDGTIHVRWPHESGETCITAPAASGQRTLADRFAHAGRPLNTRCGQHGLCAGCTVELVAGEFHQRDGRVIVAPAEIKTCQGDLQPGASARLAVLPRSVITHRPQVVTTFKVNVTAAHQPIVPVEPGLSDHGLAIDIGTTTVAVALVDLVTGRIVAEKSGFNRQVELGDDVLTRIQLAGEPSRREALRQAIVMRTLGPLLREVCAAARIEPDRVGGAVVAGNTTMLHLLTGTDPTSMGVAPFRPVFTDHRVYTAGELGWETVLSATPVHLLPGFSAYVGADLIAGCLCTGILNDAGPNLLLDVGTNGEIVLRHGTRVRATATAAGPAFEGGRLKCGVRAVPGAIAHVAFSPESFAPRLEVIPGAPHLAGLCGSAYVDVLAEGIRGGMLTPSGRFDADRWLAVPPQHRYERGDRRGWQLRADDRATIVTESDIAQLLQAKAAIAAGILTLLRSARLTPADINRLYLAGGFGLHLNVDHAITCGLLPGFRPEQIEVVGNTSLGGAWLALVDRTILPEMEAAAVSAEIVELNLDPQFENTFIDQLTLSPP
jgi:uncharacterized 2Fe-2S/4Fe-4S cluster protein (DUF4445 family)